LDDLFQVYLTIPEGIREVDKKIWKFKDPQYPVYPTEKNLDMLNLIIKTSSAPDSYVLDCFCGSGTTLKAAHLNGRKWIGIDRSYEAIKATRKKLSEIEEDLFMNKVEFTEIQIFPSSFLDRTECIDSVTVRREKILTSNKK